MKDDWVGGLGGLAQAGESEFAREQGFAEDRGTGWT
jgi:hypothetical protein